VCPLRARYSLLQCLVQSSGLVKLTESQQTKNLVQAKASRGMICRSFHI